MKLNTWLLTTFLALLSAPAMAQDYYESQQKALEYQDKALELYEEECRSLYHQAFFVGRTRYMSDTTKEEAMDRFLNQDKGEVVGESIEAVVIAFYDRLPDAPPDSTLSNHLIRDLSLTFYAMCMGIIKVPDDS